LINYTQIIETAGTPQKPHKKRKHVDEESDDVVDLLRGLKKIKSRIRSEGDLNETSRRNAELAFSKSKIFGATKLSTRLTKTHNSYTLQGFVSSITKSKEEIFQLYY
jgi:hypothetical protein